MLDTVCLNCGCWYSRAKDIVCPICGSVRSVKRREAEEKEAK